MQHRRWILQFFPEVTYSKIRLCVSMKRQRAREKNTVAWANRMWCCYMRAGPNTGRTWKEEPISFPFSVIYIYISIGSLCTAHKTSSCLSISLNLFGADNRCTIIYDNAYTKGPEDMSILYLHSGKHPQSKEISISTYKQSVWCVAGTLCITRFIQWQVKLELKE